MATRVLKVEIVGDARGFQRSVNEIESHTKRLASGFSKVTGAIGLGFAALGGAAVIGGIKGLIDEAREAEQVGRITEARIKSTGGAANVSAKDIDRLTTSLSNKVGVDDDLIASGANMLLTFKGVRNEVGRGNDIFNRATKLAVDLAAGMNQGEVSAQGLQTANVQLGKALEDPIRGITALRKAGVSFTAAQKDQIKALVESGKTLDAQKIILKAVGDQFAGTAAAASDPWQKLNVVLGNLREELGKKLLPLFNSIATWLAETIPQALDDLSTSLHTARDWWDKNYSSIKVLAEAFRADYSPAAEGATGSTDDMRTSAQKLRAALDRVLEWSLRLAQGYDILAMGSQVISIGFLNIVKAAGKVINVIDRLSGGTGHAGDEFVHFADEGLAKAHHMLEEIQGQAKRTQQAIDHLHGKDIAITATTSLHFTKTFTQKDWLNARLAAGRAAKGARITQGSGPTADDVPIWVSKGETVVPAAASADPAFQMWAGTKGIPGFAVGGVVGVNNTNQAYTGVGRIMDRWGTLLMAAGVKAIMGSGGGSAAIKAFIKSLDSHPYVWGAAGPGGYDCSGITGAVALAHRHQPYGHGQRVWTTGSIHAGILGIQPGLGGVYQIGVTAGSGHMVGRYGGLGFEAESTRTGIKIGSAATRPESMARHFHMATGGRIDRALLAAWASLAGMDVGGDAGTLRVAGRTYDRGGWLDPGWTLAYNGTGRSEPVGAGPTYVFSFPNMTVLGGDARKVARELEPAIRSAMRRSLGREGKALAKQL